MFSAFVFIGVSVAAFLMLQIAWGPSEIAEDSRNPDEAVSEPTKLQRLLSWFQAPSIESCRAWSHRVHFTARLCPSCGISCPSARRHARTTAARWTTIATIFGAAMGINYLVASAKESARKTLEFQPIVGSLVDDEPTTFSPIRKPERPNEKGDDTAVLQRELKTIETELVQQFASGEHDTSAIAQRLEKIGEVAREKKAKADRKPWESGYTLEERKKAAVLTLIQQGWSPSDAFRTVEKLEKSNLLPDPARR